MTPSQRVLRNEKIVAAFQAGRTCGEIGVRFNLNRRTVLSVINKAGLHGEDGGLYVRLAKAERDAREKLVISLFLARKTGSHISQKLNIPLGEVYRTLRKAHLSGKDGGCSALKRHLDEIEEQNRARRDLLRKHRFLNILYPPYPREASHVGH